MSENNKSNTYPFPDGDDDLLKQKFNIDLRVYSTEQKDEAATAWVDFCRSQVDSSMFIKLIALCDGSLTEATVLWDLLKFHRTTGNKLMAWREQSAQDYVERYGIEFGVSRSYRRAFDELGADGLIIHSPVSTNNPRKFRLDWIDFSNKIKTISSKLPALSVLVEVSL